MLNFFNEGYLKYHEKNFQNAIDCFNKALNLNPEDQTSKLYIERCQNFITTPPPDDWDGVFVMTTK